MTPEKLSELDYEGCQAEKRDRMNARLQAWSLLVGLVGAFGLASLQPGAVAYVVALYPLLASCLARQVGHSELILDRLKEYLLTLEQKTGYRGYEHWNVFHSASGSGGHKRALRDAILLTDVLAVMVVVFRLVTTDLVAVAVVVAVVELAAAIGAAWWLRD